MKKKTFKKLKLFLLCMTVCLFSMTNSYCQDISSTATNFEDSFNNGDGYSGNLADYSGYNTSSGNNFHQQMASGVLRVKSQYKRHQKITPFYASAGNVVTFEMTFQIEGTLVANQNIFSFGLKKRIDNVSTAPTNDDSMYVRIGVTTDNKLQIQDKTNAALESVSDNVCTLTIKYFVGSDRSKSRMKAKLTNGTTSSGWINYNWLNNGTYEALTGGGAYMSFGSGPALGTSTENPILKIDNYKFTAQTKDNLGAISGTGDPGIIQLGTNNINSAAAWSTGVLPTATDRVFIFHKPLAFIDNASGVKTYAYIYIDENSKLEVRSLKKLTINDSDIDGQLDIVSGGFKEGNFKIGTAESSNYNTKISLDNTQNVLTIAPGGYILRKNTLLLRYYTPTGQSVGAYWDSYNDSTGWNYDANFPVGTTDYSSQNLVLTAQNHNSQLDQNSTFNDIYILDGKKLVISSNGKITANNLYVYDNTDSEHTIIWDGSLIVNGTSEGNISYQRYLGTDNWYLVSSPVIGQDIDTFVSAEGLASGTNINNMGLASYDNTSAAWSYYQSGASGTGSFALGSGRSIKSSTAGNNINFTGTMPVENVSIAITSNTNGYNLVGNPYPSNIAANTAADSSNNILSVNTSILSEETLWFWNQATNTYDAINQAPSSMYIAPAQGFFVETSGSNTLSITEAMQSHQSSDSFQRLSNERPEISLVLSDGENTRGTDIYYIDGTTTGFDNGYDSTTFGGADNSFSIYTHLVANSNGEDLAIQSLPNSDLDTMIIPVGITAAAGEQISISANAINLPEGVNIYLEDKSDDSFTLLDSTSAFTTTPDEDLNGIGRFYIHTTATALSGNQVSLTNVSMYLVDRNLTITGVHTANASVRVYDLVGKEVVNTSFEGTGLNKIELPILTTGVYVVQLETQTEAVNKKIIIKK